jgi:hypothetical protein
MTFSTTHFLIWILYLITERYVVTLRSLKSSHDVRIWRILAVCWISKATRMRHARAHTHTRKHVIH